MDNLKSCAVEEKRQRRRPRSYRPMTLLSQLYKLFTRILLQRVSHQLKFRRGLDGFKAGCSTQDHILGSQSVTGEEQRILPHHLRILVPKNILLSKKRFDDVHLLEKESLFNDGSEASTFMLFPILRFYSLICAGFLGLRETAARLQPLSLPLFLFPATLGMYFPAYSSRIKKNKKGAHS